MTAAPDAARSRYLRLVRNGCGWMAICAALTTPLSAQGVRGNALNEVVVARDVMVPMRDGARMATDVYRPAEGGEALPGPFPTLLTRTPYGKAGAAGVAHFLAERGYAVVVQDVRGRFGSEGRFYVYLNEGRDGYDAVEWAAAQPWSNGRVGTYGGSYLAATQMALAVEGPPHLRSMYVEVGTSNYWEDGAGAGGAFYLLHNLDYALSLAATSQEVSGSPELAASLDYRSGDGQPVDRLGDWFVRYPLRQGRSPLSAAPVYEAWYEDWVEHQVYDEYWQQNGYTFERYFSLMPDIPIYFVGGWYDIFLRGTLRSYADLSSLQDSAKRLMIGPWQHSLGTRATGDVQFGADAAWDLRQEQLRWFDETLREEESPSPQSAPVRLFLMGGGDGAKDAEGLLRHGGRWVEADGWPPSQVVATSLYFTGEGELVARPPDDGTASTTYQYDPADPVPTIGGKIASGRALVPPGPFDQRCSRADIFMCDDDLPLSARRDVLVFQTEPLSEELIVAGEVKVRLWVASSAVDTDFTAKLMDVHPPSVAYPEGYAMLLADRIVRARYRDGLEEESLMVPGTVYEVEVDLLGTANHFKAGHRIRVDISSSNFPFFDANPNTGERLGRHTRTEKALNTIYHSRDRPSHVSLPVMPAGTLRPASLP